MFEVESDFDVGVVDEFSTFDAISFAKFGTFRALGSLSSSSTG